MPSKFQLRKLDWTVIPAIAIVVMIVVDFGGCGGVIGNLLK
jgi:hypothetical protein